MNGTGTQTGPVHRLHWDMHKVFSRINEWGKDANTCALVDEERRRRCI